MSTTPWISLFAAAALGGAVSAGITLVAVGSRSEAAPAPKSELKTEEAPADPLEPSDTTDSPNYDDKIRKLERRISLLTASLGQNKPGSDGGDGALAPGDVDVADPVFEAAVLDIMDREQERKEGEREQRREQLRATQTQRMSGRLGEQLGLDDAQQERIQSVLKEHFEAISAMRQSEDAPVTRREWRQRFDTLRTQTEEKLNAVFSPAQKAQYDALDPDDKISLGWGGGRRDRNSAGSDSQAQGNAQGAR